MNHDWPEIPDIEWSQPASDGDQAAPNWNDRIYLQREQDHFGFIVIGSPDDETDGSGVIRGIHIGVDCVEAPDITLRVIGNSSIEEWRAHVLWLFGPEHLAEFDRFAPRHKYIVRAIAE